MELADSGSKAVVAQERVRPGLATGLLLVEGFCSLAIQMIALRMLVPVAGQSIGVTSIVITVFLGALALGYRAGGAYRGSLRARVARNLVFAAGWSAVWLSHGGVGAAFAATGILPALVQVGLYAVVGVGPAAYLLAETVVVLVECREDEAAAARAGGVFSASTVGNVAGGLVTALVVMQYLGIAAAVVLVVLLLVGAAVAVMRPGGGWALRGAMVFAALSAGANVAVERGSYVRTTTHANYALEEFEDGARELLVNGQRASREDPRGIGHRYLERIEDLVYGRGGKGGALQVLVIGAGGFTFGRGRPAAAAEVVFVDVDRQLEEVAERFLAPGRRRGSYQAVDGRAFLLREERLWDVIVLDAYTERTAMPAHLYTREFFQLVRARLAPGGTMHMNLIARSDPGRFEIRADRTVRSVFAWCEVEAIGAGSGWLNRVYGCRRSALDGDRTVYRDGNTVGEVDAIGLAAGWLGG